MQSLEAGNKREVTTILKQFKLSTGAVNFPVVFSIPITDRIPALAANDFTRTNLVIIGALTMAFEAMNQKRGMNEFQILNLAEEIIDTSSEDNLSLEDLMLFLQNLVRGKYKIAYESFDIPKFMELFEIYRQERHYTILEYRKSEHLQYTGMGDINRTRKENPISEHLSNLSGRISEMKEAISDQKQKDTMIKADKFFEGK